MFTRIKKRFSEEIFSKKCWKSWKKILCIFCRVLKIDTKCVSRGRFRVTNFSPFSIYMQMCPDQALVISLETVLSHDDKNKTRSQYIKSLFRDRVRKRPICARTSLLWWQISSVSFSYRFLSFSANQRQNTYLLTIFESNCRFLVIFHFCWHTTRWNKKHNRSLSLFYLKHEFLCVWRKRAIKLREHH